MTRVGRNDPCICGSDKKFKKCCGPKVNNDERYVSDTVKVSNAETKRFFITDANLDVPVRNDKQQIMVWLDRTKALQWGHANIASGLCPDPFAAVGMGDEKWELFKEHELFKIMDPEVKVDT